MLQIKKILQNERKFFSNLSVIILNYIRVGYEVEYIKYQLFYKVEVKFI